MVGSDRPRGLLVAIEGADGAGTTTQAARLSEWLAARGRSVHLTREPSSGAVGVLIRAVLSGAHPGLDPAALALLFAADRLDHLGREIAPALAGGAVVVSDRYVMSSLVYQSLEVDAGFVGDINRRAAPPDLTVLIDVPPEVAAERRARRGGKPELFEEDEVQRRVIASYRRHAQAAGAAGQDVVIVDGTADEQSVFARLRAEVARRLGIAREEQVA